MWWLIPVGIVVILILWFISAQRRLVKLDENVGNAMSQIGVQLESRWDALSALVELTKGYNSHEYETLAKVVGMRGSVTSKSTAADVNAQENMITEAMGKFIAVAEAYPDLKANQNYSKAMDSVNMYEQTVRSSRMIYNDCVTKFNRAVRMFPGSIAAAMMGFSVREDLEQPKRKTQMPDMSTNIAK